MTDGISQRQLLRRFSTILGALLFSSGLLALGVYLWAENRVRGPIEVSVAAAPGPGDATHGREGPNLTSRRSFAAWDLAIRHGVGEDGRPLVMMPSDGYSKLSVRDLRDLVAYLEELELVSKETPKTKLSPLGLVLAATGALPVPALSLDHAAISNEFTQGQSGLEPLARGQYLLDVSGCRGCHGDQLQGRTMGPSLPDAPALTSAALRMHGRDAFVSAMKSGRGHDGRELHSVMPWRAFSSWPPEDVDAVWSALMESP